MAEIIVTPVVTAVRYALTKPDEPIKLPDGRIVGDEKYKLIGFFDPTSDEGETFIAKAVAALEKEKVKGARENVLFNLPENRELANPLADIPEHYRRITAKTKFGPVETIDKTGRALDGDTALFPGAKVRLGVTFFLFEDQRQRGKKSVAFRLQTVLVLPGGERIRVGNRPAAKTVFASLLGETTSVDPFAEDEPAF